MEFLYLIFYACLKLRFLDIETKLGQRRPVPTVSRLLCCNVRGQEGNLSDMAVASSRYDILFAFSYIYLRLWSQICVMCQSCWFPDLVALSCCAGAGCLEPEGWRHPYEIDMEHFTNLSLSVVVAKFGFLGFVERDRTYMCIVFTATPT